MRDEKVSHSLSELLGSVGMDFPFGRVTIKLVDLLLHILGLLGDGGKERSILRTKVQHAKSIGLAVETLGNLRRGNGVIKCNLLAEGNLGPVFVALLPSRLGALSVRPVTGGAPRVLREVPQ